MKKTVLLVIFSLILLLSSCNVNADKGGRSGMNTKADDSAAEVEEKIAADSYAGFLDALKKAGFEYTEGDESSEESFFSVERQYVLIGDDIISLYEYETNEAMEADAACVDSGGCSINVPGRSVCISWVSLPHFYKNENLIINYVGENEQILDFLEANYGKEFAGAGR